MDCVFFVILFYIFCGVFGSNTVMFLLFWGFCYAALIFYSSSSGNVLFHFNYRELVVISTSPLLVLMFLFDITFTGRMNPEDIVIFR